MFDTVATPQELQDNLEALEEGKEFDKDSAALLPTESHTINMNDITHSKEMVLTIENHPNILPQIQYYHHIQSLNKDQRKIFNYIQNWCDGLILNGKHHEPLHLFISGGAGTGKSHLITAIFQLAYRKFSILTVHPDDLQICVTAPTGTAAFNISGSTLHSAFLLPINQKNTESYKRLSDEKISTLRNRAGNLKLLIIDEISMVGSSMMEQINSRLIEITGSNTEFGGVSVLAFGDLYQLAPVRQKYIFKASNNIHECFLEPLWKKFKLVELNEVMRQNDDLSFAQLLNRVRTGSQTEEDIQILQQRDVSLYSNIDCHLHLFCANRDVDEHNLKMLNQLPSPIKTLSAIDNVPKSQKISDNPIYSAGIPEKVIIAVGAKVMLIKNIDTSDGLVNGAHGEVTAFVYDSNQKVKAILIKFQNETVGRKKRAHMTHQEELLKFPSSTPIERSTTTFQLKNSKIKSSASRSQFPIKLSFACTIHKVQGLTVQNVVIDFTGKFADGQAYVALSRVKNITGLYLRNFDPKKIHANSSVKLEMASLRKEKLLPITDIFLHESKQIKFSVLNIRSLVKHQDDLTHDPWFQKSNIVILTETWCDSDTHLNLDNDIVEIRLDKSYHENHSARSAGGIAIFTNSSQQIEVLDKYRTDKLQILMVKYNLEITIISVYKSPSLPSGEFISCIALFLKQINPLEKTLIVGDFNENLLKDERICQYLSEQKFHQHIQKPTHIEGGILDHVYTKNITEFSYMINSTYYSDHLWVNFVIPE